MREDETESRETKTARLKKKRVFSYIIFGNYIDKK